MSTLSPQIPSLMDTKNEPILMFLTALYITNRVNKDCKVMKNLNPIINPQDVEKIYAHCQQPNASIFIFVNHLKLYNSSLLFYVIVSMLF